MLLIGLELTRLEGDKNWYALMFSPEILLSSQEQYLIVQIKIHFFFLIHVKNFQKYLKFNDSIINANDMRNDNLRVLFIDAQLEIQNVDHCMIANKLSINRSKLKRLLFKSSRFKLTHPHLFTCNCKKSKN